MKDCIFCKIAAHQAESNIVFENDDFISFSTLEPVSKGHVLVVPKSHAETISDMTEGSLLGLGEAMKKTAEIAVTQNDATGYNFLQANGTDAQQSVFHVHFHLVPRYPNDGLDLWIKQGL